MATTHLRIDLKGLICLIPSEKIDEVFLIFDSRRIWPVKGHFKKMGGGRAEVAVQLDGIPKNNDIKIELWEYDSLSSNDHLGDFNLRADKPGGPYLAEMIRNPQNKGISRYQLEWEIL